MEIAMQKIIFGLLINKDDMFVISKDLDKSHQ